MQHAVLNAALAARVEYHQAEPADMGLAVPALHVHAPLALLDGGFALGAVPHVVLGLVLLQRLLPSVGMAPVPFLAGDTDVFLNVAGRAGRGETREARKTPTLITGSVQR